MPGMSPAAHASPSPRAEATRSDGHDRSSDTVQRVEAELFQAQQLIMLGQVAGGIVHDFNNILTVIGGHAAVALTRQDLDEPTRRTFGEIYDAVRYANDLTGQLLETVRSPTPARSVCDLNKTVGQVAAVLGRILSRNLILQTRLTPEAPVVAGDPATIRQILMNLCLNARDAMPRGGVIRLHTRRAAASSPGHVVLVVSDTGTGMSPELLARVFESFFSTRRGAHGSGLGLGIVKRLVDQLGGLIDVQSRPGKGTRFRINLPTAS